MVLKSGAVVELKQPFPHPKGAAQRVDSNVAKLMWQDAEGSRPAGIMVVGDLAETVIARDADGMPIVQVDANKKRVVVADPSSLGVPGICGPGLRPIYMTKVSDQYLHRKLAMIFLPYGEHGTIDYWENIVDLPQGTAPGMPLEQIQKKLAEDINAQLLAAQAQAEGEEEDEDEDDEDEDDDDTLAIDAHSILCALLTSGKTTPDQSGIDLSIALVEQLNKTVQAKREKELAELEAEAKAEEEAEAKAEADEIAAESAAATTSKKPTEAPKKEEGASPSLWQPPQRSRRCLRQHVRSRGRRGGRG